MVRPVHLATVLLDVVTGNKTIHVPYRGAGPALNDLVAGQTQYMVTSLPSVMGLIEGKRVRPLAVTTRERSALMPAVPSVAESGWSEYDAGAWYGFAVPKGTPVRIVEMLRNATAGALTDETVRSRLIQDGSKPVGSTPDEFGAFMKKETVRWASTVKAAGISME
jgi:tripartite-type tricarboxylate transporter receptor subunit TctC